MSAGHFEIIYDFDGIPTGWLLYRDGIVLSKHPTWEAAKAAMEAGE